MVLVDSVGNEKATRDSYIYEIFYFEMPLMLQYHLSIADDNISARIYGGISPAIKLSAKTIYTYSTPNYATGAIDTVLKASPLNYVRSFNVSPVVGLWVGDKNPDHKIKLFGDIRFEYSFLPVFDRLSANGTNMQTNMWTVNFGFGARF